jgi:hypothetical protein
MEMLAMPHAPSHNLSSTPPRLLFESSAPVDAPVQAVRELIDNGWVVDAFLPHDDTAANVDIDHRPGVVGIQGRWWYRGEISAFSTNDRTMLTYRVYNVARRAAWAVPPANRFFLGYRRSVQHGVTALARAIEQQLG